MTLGNAANPVRSISLHTVTIPRGVLSNYQAGKKKISLGKHEEKTQLHNLHEFQQENIGGINH